MTILEVKTEVPKIVYLVNVEGASYDKPSDKDYIPAAASRLNRVLLLSRYA